MEAYKKKVEALMRRVEGAEEAVVEMERGKEERRAMENAFKGRLKLMYQRRFQIRTPPPEFSTGSPKNAAPITRSSNSETATPGPEILTRKPSSSSWVSAGCLRPSAPNLEP